MSVRMRGADRLWMAAGAAVALALAALSWVFLISPQNSETDGLRAEVDQVNDRVVALQARLAQLRKENEKLPEHQAKLAAQRQALPTATALSNFLREMQTAGERTGVSVSAVNTGAAGKTQAGGAEIQVLPVTLTVDGGIDGQLAFLDELQHVQPRAVLIIGANLVPGGVEAESLAGAVTMTLSVQIFVAAQPTPAPSASATASPTTN